MKLQHLTIRAKLLLVNSIFVLSSLFLLSFNFATQYLNNQASIIAESHEAFLEGYATIDAKITSSLIIEKDFVTSRDVALLPQHERLLEQVKKEMLLLREVEQLSHQIDKLNNIDQILEEYQQIFQEVVTLTYENGLSHEDGLLGALRTAVHQAESILSGGKELALVNSMLMMRRHEKDYLSREQDVYLSKIRDEYQHFLGLLAKADNLTDIQRYTIQEFVNDYLRKFFNLVDGKKSLESKNAELYLTVQSLTVLLDKATSEARDEYRAFEEGQSQLKQTIHAYEYLLLGFVLLVVIPMTTLLSRGITRSTARVQKLLEEISQGDADLSKRLSVESNDEMAKISKAFNTFMEKLQGTLNDINDLSQNLYRTAMMSQQMTDKTNEAIRVEVSAIARIAQSIDEMTRSVDQVASSSQSASVTANAANANALSGAKVVTTVMKNIEDLAVEVNKASETVSELARNTLTIDTAVDMIMNISKQTNLLALNAAIEAARAGEHGRGFAVVADEVRALAARTTHASEEIKAIVDSLRLGSKVASEAMMISTTKAGESVEQSKRAGTSLEEITKSVGLINAMNAEIATAAGEQSTMAADINYNIVSVTNAVNELASTAKQSISDGGDLSQTAALLQTLTARFGKLESAGIHVEARPVNKQEHDIELF